MREELLQAGEFTGVGLSQPTQANAVSAILANDAADRIREGPVLRLEPRTGGHWFPGEWLPLLERCRYIGERVAVKHRWDLTVDHAEKDSLTLQAGNCENVVITVIEP